MHILLKYLFIFRVIYLYFVLFIYISYYLFIFYVIYLFFIYQICTYRQFNKLKVIIHYLNSTN